ncbi:hypothetical protein FB451DRAFT_1367467 [Mycena latifolia]|nr:hypothetical protein FB451DRAFT_1367467 [Mycena latifolia]
MVSYDNQFIFVPQREPKLALTKRLDGDHEKTNETKKTTTVVVARTAAVHGEAGGPARRGARGRWVRALQAERRALARAQFDAAPRVRAVGSPLLDVADLQRCAGRGGARRVQCVPDEGPPAAGAPQCTHARVVCGRGGRIQAEMADCTGIVDVDEREIAEDLNGCIGAWIRERLAPATPPLLPPPLTLPPARPITVGIHIRWGDTGTLGNTLSHFRDSMNVPALLGTHGVRLTVAMKNAEEGLLAELKETEYTLLGRRDRGHARAHCARRLAALRLVVGRDGAPRRAARPHGRRILLPLRAVLLPVRGALCLARGSHCMHSGPPVPAFPHLSHRHNITAPSLISRPSPLMLHSRPASREYARAPPSFLARPRHPRRARDPRTRGAPLALPRHAVLALGPSACMYYMYVPLRPIDPSPSLRVVPRV